MFSKEEKVQAGVIAALVTDDVTYHEEHDDCEEITFDTFLESAFQLRDVVGLVDAPDRVINAIEDLLAHDVAVVVAPASDYGIETTDQDTLG